MSELPRLMAISPQRLDRGYEDTHALLEAWIRWAGAVDAEEASIIQLRARELTGAQLYEVTRRIRPWVKRSLVVVSARVDVALAAGADGIQLPEDGLPAGAVRGLVGRRLWIGRSVHGVAGVEQARSEGADWVTLAPVFKPLSKATEDRPLGLDLLEEACRHEIPVFALGGVSAENRDRCLRRGAYGVAGITIHASAGLGPVHTP